VFLNYIVIVTRDFDNVAIFQYIEPSKHEESTYKQAGVNIDRGEEFVD